MTDIIKPKNESQIMRVSRNDIWWNMTIINSSCTSRLGNNINAKGNITLYTDLYPCPSCQYVIEQFMKKYPNIKVNIIYKLD